MPKEKLELFHGFLSLGLLGFFVLSIFVFLMTGKSLLWRMSEFVSENQPEDVRPLQFYERNADYILEVDEACAELPDLLVPSTPISVVPLSQ